LLWADLSIQQKDRQGPGEVELGLLGGSGQAGAQAHGFVE
jgi:hypothetical protein